MRVYSHREGKSLMVKVLMPAILACVLLLLLYTGQGASTPFLFSFVIAYIIQPIPRKLSSVSGMSYSKSVLVLVIALIILILLVTTSVVPLLYTQSILLVQKIPQYQTDIQRLLKTWMLRLDRIGSSLDVSNNVRAQVSTLSHNMADSVLTYVSLIAQNIWKYTMLTIGYCVTLVLLPFIVYYFLLDWDKITHYIYNLVHPSYRYYLINITNEIGDTLSLYIRGQLNTCLILSALYVVCFIAIGLDFSVLLGALCGISIVLPFVGPAVSWIFVISVAYLSIEHGIVYKSAIILIAGNILEGYYLTPRFMQNQIGLHPLWTVFSVMYFAQVWGFSGALFAIPISAVLKVLLSHIMMWYKEQITSDSIALEPVDNKRLR